MSHLRRELHAIAGGFPATFWWLWAGTLVNALGQFVFPFLALYLVARGFSVAEAGGIVAGMGLGAIFAAPLGGVLADRIGRRATLVGSLVLGATMTTFLALVRDPLAIRIGVFLLGLTTQMYRPAMQASVADLVPPERRARAYGLVYWAVNIGFGAALSIGGALAAANYTSLFLADAAAMLVFGFIVWRKVPETRPARAIAAVVAPRPPVGGSTDPSVPRDPFVVSLSNHERRGSALRAGLRKLVGRVAALGDDVRPLFRDRVLLAFLALHFLFATVMFQFNVSVPIDMRRNGIGPAGYGLLMALNGVTIAILQPFAARVLAPFERARVMAFAALLLGVGYGLFAVAQTRPLYALAIVIWTLGEICHTPMATATVADLAPAALRGRYQGAYGMAWGLAMFVGTQLGADVLHRFGPTALWGGCLAVGVVVAAGQLAAGPARRRRLAAATADGATVHIA